MSRLTQLREEIDRLDAALLGLLEQRARAAIAIGRLKADAGLPVRVPTREAEVLARVGGMADVLPEAAVRRVFEAVIAESRRVQS